MLSQSIGEILCQSGVVVTRFVLAFEDIDVEEAFHGVVPACQAVVSERILPARLRIPRYARNGYGVAAFALRSAPSEGWWAQQGSNLRPEDYETINSRFRKSLIIQQIALFQPLTLAAISPHHARSCSIAAPVSRISRA